MNVTFIIFVPLLVLLAVAVVLALATRKPAFLLIPVVVMALWVGARVFGIVYVPGVIYAALAAGCLILIATLLAKSQHKAFLIALLAVLLVPVALMILKHRRIETVAPVTNQLTVLASPPQSQTAPVIWRDGIEDQFEADVYSSQQQAALALARETVGLLPEVTPDHTLPAALTVYGQRDLTIQLLNAFADELREQSHIQNIVVQTVLPKRYRESLDPNTAAVVMDIAKYTPMRSSRDGIAIDGDAGTLRIEIEGVDTEPTQRTVEFMERPWVQNLSLVLNHHPNLRLAVARSSHTCTTELEAQEQGMARARQLVTRELRKLKTPAQMVLPQELAVTDQDLVGRDIIVDRFTQSFRGSAGRIWRHAILLDLQPDRLSGLFRSKLSQIRVVRRTWVQYGASFAGLALIVFILYIFLNAATRGYYTWALRIAAVALTSVLVVIVLMLT